MKKTLALSIVLLAAFACNKEVDVVAPEEHPLVPMTFTADIEDTKAFFEGVKSYWEKDDAISVCKGVTSTGYTDAPVLVAATSGASTTFTGKAPEGLTKYLAAYPARNISKWKRDSGTTKDTAYGTIKETQVAKIISTTTSGVNNYMDPDVIYLCGTAGEDLKFNFKHPLAYIKFTVPSGLKIRTVTVSAGPVVENALASTGKKIGGGFTMQWVNTYWNMGLQGGVTKIAIKSDVENGYLSPGNYYIALFPRASSTNADNNYSCISFDFYSYINQANHHVFKTISGGTVDFKIAGGTVYNIGTLPTTLFD